MKLHSESAANRIALAAFLAYAGATLVLGVAVYFATHTAFSRQMDARIEQASEAIVAEFQEDHVAGVLEALKQRNDGGPDALGFALFDAAGHKIGGGLNLVLPPVGWHRISFIDPLEGADSAQSLTISLDGQYTLVVAEDLEALEGIDRAILIIFGSSFAVLLGLGIVGAFVLATFLRRRLATIKMTADAIIAGDLTKRAAVGSQNDEFDLAAISLNAMLDRIVSLIGNLRQVTGDLAHDLRTPLSRLRNHLDRMHSLEDPAARNVLIEDAVTQADDVLVLFDAILRISEVEEGSLRRAFGPIDLSRLANELGETLSPLAEDSGKHLDLDVQPGLSVQGDRELLAQALINLVENALRHTPDGATIELAARSDKGRPMVSVSDDGPGIPEADRARVLQRFVRLEASRSTPGHGLGLSLARAIAEAHGASFELGDANPGLVALIRFPVAV